MTGEIDILALHLVGGRLRNEPSHAAPVEFYDDPAKTVRLSIERCTDCKYERMIMAGEHIGIGICMKKNKDGSKRLYGTRCDDFRGKGTK